MEISFWASFDALLCTFALNFTHIQILNTNITYVLNY